MKILSIGNSFSQDAHRYIHKLAKREGENIKCVNLYIGGCSLRTHYLNMLDNVAAYAFEFNGENTGIKVSISQALASDDWDYVTLQQVSSQSTRYETYTPYLEELYKYVRRYAPAAKILIHQTWAYEDGSQRLANMKFERAEDMLAAAREAYNRAAEDIGAFGIIPSGEAMINAVRGGIGTIHRDTFHASFGAGRYLLALTWYKKLTGNDISENSFDDFDVPVTEEERRIVIDAVNAAFN